jgi:hypothetical protein
MNAASVHKSMLTLMINRKPRRMMDARLHAWVADALTRGWTPELID